MECPPQLSPHASPEFGRLRRPLPLRCLLRRPWRYRTAASTHPCPHTMPTIASIHHQLRVCVRACGRVRAHGCVRARACTYVRVCIRASKVRIPSPSRPRPRMTADAHAHPMETANRLRTRARVPDGAMGSPCKRGLWHHSTLQPLDTTPLYTTPLSTTSLQTTALHTTPLRAAHAFWKRPVSSDASRGSGVYRGDDMLDVIDNLVCTGLLPRSLLGSVTCFRYEVYGARCLRASVGVAAP